jgi:hypothetical protein
MPHTTYPHSASGILTASQAVDRLVSLRIYSPGAKRLLAIARADKSTTFYLPWLWRSARPCVRIAYVARNAYEITREPTR